MNDSNVFAEMLIEVGRITNELRNELSNNEYLLNRADEENKKLSEITEKYRREIFSHQKSIEEWKVKCEVLGEEVESQKEIVNGLKSKITKLRKRKKL